MRTYLYRSRDGELHEYKLQFGCVIPEELVVSEGEISHLAFRDRQAEVVTHSISVRGGSGNVRKTWPLECFGSGVHADQAPELRKHFKEHGVNVEVSKDGNPIYTSAAQRKKALKCRGLIDKASFC